MSGDFLVNTSTEGLRPLGTAPQRSFELVTGTVAARLGPAHAALFAEPVSGAHGERTDWYATVSGHPRRLDALDPPEAERARAELARLVGDIRALATELAASGSGDDQRLGEALANALEVPGEDSIWVLTGLPDGRLQPVLVNWAWIADRQQAVRGVLSGVDTRTPPPPPRPAPGAVPPALPAGAPPGPPPGSPPGPPPGAMAPLPPPGAAAAPAARGASPLLWWLVWLGWLLLAAMLAAILWLAIAPCALRLPGLPGRCPAGAVALEQELAGFAAARERAVLEDRILQTERQLGIADRACQPVPVERVELPPLIPPPAPESEPESEPEPATDIDDRMQASGAQRGDLTFTLVWNSPDDLDLHVTCPLGAEISYRQKQACGGELDVDSNVTNVVPQPIENVFFTAPATGSYQVVVNYYETRTGGAPQNFEVQIRDGERVETLTGTVSSARRTWTTTYRKQG